MVLLQDAYAKAVQGAQLIDAVLGIVATRQLLTQTGVVGVKGALELQSQTLGDAAESSQVVTAVIAQATAAAGGRSDGIRVVIGAAHCRREGSDQSALRTASYDLGYVSQCRPHRLEPIAAQLCLLGVASDRIPQVG